MATLNGTTGNDFVAGTADNDQIFGLDGNDNLRGDAGNDTIAAGNGDDYVEGNLGDDLLYGEAGNDNVRGNEGNDILYLGTGDDFGAGGDGLDTIYGEEGNDLIEAGLGNDLAYGGSGNDIISDDPLGPFAAGGGDDRFYGGLGDDVIYGGTGNDTLFGDDGDGAGTRCFSYSNNFDGSDPLLGATQHLFGGAPGVTNVNNSPDPDHEKEFVFVQGFSTAQEASLAISPNLVGAERVTSFTMNFTLDMASQAANDTVDGISINFGDMSTLPGNREYENGVSEGLAIRLDPFVERHRNPLEQYCYCIGPVL
jgi:Ca2+-binding RTX toxin-like protein